MDMWSNCLLNNYVYIHRTVLLSTLIRKAYFFVMGSSECRDFLQVRVIRPCDCWIVICKWNINITTFKAQRRAGKRVWGECKSWRMWKSAVQCCLLDMTWSLHSWTRNGGYLPKTWTRLGLSIFTDDKGAYEFPSPPWGTRGSYWLLVERQGLCFLMVYLLVNCSHSRK